MKNIKLTEKQKKVLILICEYVEIYQFPPSLDELALIMKITKGAVLDFLIALKKKGYITWIDGKSRTVHVIKEGVIKVIFDRNKI